jgi:hypothetical protein
MNTVGWIGGAVATKLAGWYADNGPRENPVANMSHFIAFGGLIYLVAAGVILLVVIFFAKRDLLERRDRTSP